MPDFDMKSLSDVADVRMGQSPPSSSCSEEPSGLPFLQGCAEFGARHPTPQFYCNPPLRTARAKSILISVRAPVGDMNIADQDYCIGRGLGAVAGTHADTAFLFYSMEHHRRQLQRVAQGSTFEAIGSRELRGMRLPIPSRPIQERIAEILTTVDNQIEKTEALIAKYQAIKQGLMHDLFTRGVDEHGRLRPTRDEAPQLYKESELGWIPKAWETTRVDDLGEVRLGRQRSPKHQSGRFTTPYLRVANVFDGWFALTDVLEMDFTPTERETYSVTVNDIFLNEGQSLELVGRSARFDGPDGKYCFQNTLVRFRANDENIPCFWEGVFKYWLDTGRFQTVARQTTSVAHLGADRFARMLAARPGKDEQKRIAGRLHSIRQFLASEDARRDKLRNIKLGLMHDLLTGKVSVKPKPDDQDNGITPNDEVKAGVKPRREGVHA